MLEKKQVRILPNNELSDLSTPNKGHVQYQKADEFVYDIFYFGVKNNKLKLTKVGTMENFMMNKKITKIF